jgi:hypothetical protein
MGLRDSIWKALSTSPAIVVADISPGAVIHSAGAGDREYDGIRGFLCKEIGKDGKAFEGFHNILRLE